MKTPAYPKAMLADLKRSGLGSKDADALGLQAAEDGLSYAIPYLGLDGKPTGHYRVRFLGKPDELPRDKDGKAMRYSQPKGSAPRFYCAHIGGVRWKKVAVDPGATIYITEGEKKAAALCRLGISAIGLGGVWNWFEGGHALDDFNLIAWTRRKVRVVFDSDIRHKTNVQRALKRLADELIKRGAVPSEVELPALPGGGKTGVDDFLVHHGNAAKARAKFASLPERPLLMPQGFTSAQITTMKLAQPKWVVEGLIPVGLTVLAGKPKIGKSWLTLDLSLAVCAGSKVLGGYDAKRGDALHLALEDTKHRLQSRLRRVLDGARAPERGHFFLEWRRVEEHGLEALRRWLDEHRDTRLVIVDTLAKMRARPTAHGSLYHEDYDAIGALKAIADEYELGMVVVHHLRKAASDDPLDGVSGSTGLTGAVDTTLVLHRERLQADASLFVTGRDVAEQEIALSMDQRTMRWKAHGDADEYRMGQERKKIIEALTRHGQAAGPSEVALMIGKKRTSVQRLMMAMTHSGQLRWVIGGKYEIKKGSA